MGKFWGRGRKKKRETLIKKSMGNKKLFSKRELIKKGRGILSGGVIHR